MARNKHVLLLNVIQYNITYCVNVMLLHRCWQVLLLSTSTRLSTVRVLNILHPLSSTFS